ncbi:sialate O-acetylesterase [Lentisphaera profundi]|uniref:Sialate O-acetylesterase n=1 Tax=Lentisphaera profundi TaxID=1658616 RepID=A0ABY7VZS2_9BACT|nr:sialate O-acetylesterase [Lentisphaera profundi]WDE99451.1 sialate O-acetylesterase [Lentisphaera profundi]
MKSHFYKLSLITGIISTPVLADIKPAELFVNHMVIQRDTEATIWGTADPNEKVTVKASWGAAGKTLADKEGKWSVKLQTPHAGGPHNLYLEGNNKIEIKDVLSGDVWLCAGQSNMQVTVSSTTNSKPAIAKANYPGIRTFVIDRNPTNKKTNDCGGEWKVCTPQSIKKFSAVGYFTGRDLHTDLNVPIGLIGSYWGGTYIESWTPWEVQKYDLIAQSRKIPLDKKAASYTPESAKANYEKQLERWKDKAAKAKQAKKRGPRKPSLAQDPKLNQNYPANLYNGMIHPLTSFAIKGAIWYQGENNATSMGDAVHYRVQLARMVNSWRQAWGIDFPFYSVQLPNFKQAQTKPVESDNIWPAIRESYVLADGKTPDIFTSTMIDLGEAKDIHPRNKQDVGKRMASTILNKTYGKKTPTTPFMKSYEIDGNKIIIQFDYTGSGLLAKGGKLKAFAIAGKDQKFVWADAEIINKEGVDCLVVSSSLIKNPVAVRYAWADNPAECKLYSKEGFPASPFRTDSWSLIPNK